MQSDFDNNLQSYFTDMEHLRGMFKEYVATTSLPKRIIVIHGVGGSGKSSLLRMFRIHCKSEKIPVALASGDDTKSIFDVITRWMDDLKEDGVKFSSLSKTMETYRAIQAKVNDQSKKAQNAGSRMADIASKAASKTAETAGGALLGAAIGSVIPGVGTAIGGALGGVVSGMGAEALTDWLRGFLTKPDIDLLLDPAKRLTTDFLVDIAKAAEKKRLVLLLDTYEQMTALEDLVGEVAQKIQPNVLMVIAGRKLPDWNRTWQGWMASAQVEELKPMTEDIMRQLIRRYYATMRGGEPDPSQVETIIRFARGLPMVVTSAVQLWVKYNVEDFQSVKTEIVANLVDRLMEGIPSNLIPALEAAAVVRWFDQPILRAVTGLEDVRDVYNELRRFPFVRTRVEGLALHDSVREMMDENLRVQDSERHSDLHERAALYFEKRLEKVTGEDTERLGLERLYHRVRTDEETGIKLFQEMAEELTRYRLINRLRALLNDVNTYPLEQENSRLWRDYYNARLAQFEARLPEAEKIYQTIAENKSSSPKLQAYALCDYGRILSRIEMRTSPNAIQILERIPRTTTEIDSKLAEYFIQLGGMYKVQGRWNDAFKKFEEAKTFYERDGDLYGLALVYRGIKGFYQGKGNWREAFRAERQGFQALSGLAEKSYARFQIFSGFETTYTGLYLETVTQWNEAMEIASQLELKSEVAARLRDLGLIVGFQDKIQESMRHFEKSIEILQSLHESGGLAYAYGFQGSVLLRSGAKSQAEEYFMRSQGIFDSWADKWELPLLSIWWGTLYELKNEYDAAQKKYEQCLGLISIGKLYWHASALTGLVRVKHAQGNYTAIPSLLAEAEQLAQQYEYNDHLASLRLTQGHLAWETDNKNETISFYQHAIIYALRYNRFLLDELLSGRPQGTPLRPIISYCLEHGKEGKEILLALRDWWRTGMNDIGTPRQDTISPIPEGISLLEAEKIARERELGDGSMQKSVIEQFDAVL
jgi:tetratricopeptide (TPR) repeat protein